MRPWLRRIKRVALCVLIVVAVLLSVKVIRRTFFPKERTLNTLYVRLGEPIPLTEVDWAQSERTLVLALDKGCKFCTLSAEFYKRLVQEASGRKDVRIVAVFPHEAQQSHEYLNNIGVNIAEVKQATIKSLGLRGTPTVLLVNKHGVITGLWIGQLPKEKEDAVLKHFLEA